MGARSCKRSVFIDRSNRDDPFCTLNLAIDRSSLVALIETTNVIRLILQLIVGHRALLQGAVISGPLLQLWSRNASPSSRVVSLWHLSSSSLYTHKHLALHQATGQGRFELDFFNTRQV